MYTTNVVEMFTFRFFDVANKQMEKLMGINCAPVAIYQGVIWFMMLKNAPTTETVAIMPVMPINGEFFYDETRSVTVILSKKPWRQSCGSRDSRYLIRKAPKGTEIIDMETSSYTLIVNHERMDEGPVFSGFVGGKFVAKSVTYRTCQRYSR